ncbi:hypothetical protein [Cetobacterium sp.]|uniref:hypothetical protein n=1 Tax=Cetobacterium sp. TaxID=2071632 RepID=UPI003F31189F
MHRMKKIINIFLIVLSLTVSGCANSQTKMMVEQQNQEIMALQKMKMDILARPSKDHVEMTRKQADLALVESQIKQAQQAQAKAQAIENQKNNNMLKNIIVGTTAVVGTAAVIHNATN